MPPGEYKRAATRQLGAESEAQLGTGKDPKKTARLKRKALRSCRCFRQHCLGCFGGRSTSRSAIAPAEVGPAAAGEAGREPAQLRRGPEEQWILQRPPTRREEEHPQEWR
jgi:hypothetical protein